METSPTQTATHEPHNQVTGRLIYYIYSKLISDPEGEINETDKEKHHHE